ncbi:MAG: hypothetical protein D6798_04530, partial [Deltaproteobacteria bacterium]
MRAVAIAFLLPACRTYGPASQGTSVGNPGEMAARAAPSSGADDIGGVVPVEATTWTGCDGASPAVDASERDLELDGSGSIDVPGGTWCQAEIRLRGPIPLHYRTPADGEVAVDLEVGTITLASSSGVEVDGTRLLLEVGPPDWLADQAAGSPDPAVLAQRVARSSAVYIDEDGDHVLSDEERARGSVLKGADRSDNGGGTEPGDADGGAEDTGGSDDTGHADGGDADGGAEDTGG